MLSRAEIQRLRGLRERRNRLAERRFVVEGEKVVRELIAAGYPLEEILATDAFASQAPLRRVTEAEMARISHYPSPSPVLAVGRMPDHPLDPAALNQGLTLALDGIQDPGNVGTLLRIADWFGLARVLLSPDCADVFSQKTINASMGSFARVPTHVADLPPTLAAARVPVLGCDLDGEPLHQVQPCVAAVVVVGAEGRGLSAGVQGRLTRRVTIPRRGRAESLNAAVAAGIVIERLVSPRNVEL